LIFQNFAGILPEKKGIEKSLQVKKFIKRVDYSRDEIALLLYYNRSGEADSGISASNRAEESAGGNSDSCIYKNDLFTPNYSLNNSKWLGREDSN